MNLKVILAAAVIAALPFYAQAQPKAGPKVTKADALKVVKIVSADKAKLAAYCDIAKIGDQIEQAEQKKDEKKIDALAQQMDALGQKIGPEYVALMDGLQELDEKAGEEVGAVLEPLDKMCAK